MSKERRTRTKEAVEQILQSYASPIALSELHQFIKQSLPSTAFSTIYRIVTKLHTEGKIIQIDWRERGSHYEWADLPHHHHLICSTCGRVIDIDDNILGIDVETIVRQTGFSISHHSIEVEGICPDCQRKANN